MKWALLVNRSEWRNRPAHAKLRAFIKTTTISLVHICFVSTNFFEKEEVLRSAESKIKK